MDFMVMGPNAVLTLSNKKVIGYLWRLFHFVHDYLCAFSIFPLSFLNSFHHFYSFTSLCFNFLIYFFNPPGFLIPVSPFQQL